LKLGPRIQISAPLGLEGGAPTVQLTASSQEELARLARDLNEAVEKKGVSEIFQLLGGKGAKADC
jgi:hypothetical protein